MIRKASQGDLQAIERFLAPRAATSMFLAGNIRDHGLNASGHPKATTVWLSRDDGQVTGVFGLTEAGYFIFDAPEVPPAEAAALRRALAGRRISSLTGEARQAEAMLAALELDRSQIGFSDEEPHFRLQLRDLQMPSGGSTLRPMHPEDVPLITEWRHAYDKEIFGSQNLPEIRRRSTARAEALVDSGRGRILELGGLPVAMTAFNAVLPRTVQIGGVYTPPGQRSRGFARRAVALHLAEAHENGVQEAILFASGTAAIRAYRKLGFQRIGDYRIVEFSQPVAVGGQ
ncbi:GNAT family N-acetyltransferase [Leisingera thetidis]|uniref:GNAT family N-acetyltransferase n=1 Tax=Leisingera thetidis TaxID=2930199 RepID=UPI0021F7FC67|nr:GNAT family N-acetyltransferase [Leisingera thetidis]